MKNIRIIFLLVALFSSQFLHSQEKRRIKADSIRLYNDTANAELNLKIRTSDSSGFLFNKGGGAVKFTKIITRVSDSGIFLAGMDSIPIHSKGMAGGTNGSVQFTSGIQFAGTNDSLMYWNDSAKTLHLGEKSFVSDFAITSKNLDTIYTEPSGISLINQTTAVAGSQQRSPGIRFEGYGFTTASSMSRVVEVNNYLLPIEGTSEINYAFYWEKQRANAATRYVDMRLQNGLSIFSGGFSLCNTPPTGNGDIIGENLIHHYIVDAPATTIVSYSAATGNSLSSKFIKLNNGNDGFHPSSGNASFSMLSTEMKINQTGSASGVTRGLYINPTIVSAVDYRAIEISVGKSYLRSVHLTGIGDKLNIATGTNSSVGSATLSGGTVTVNTTAVSTGSKIFLSCVTPSGTSGYLSAPSASITNGTSFVINSTSGTDASTVFYWIVN